MQDIHVYVKGLLAERHSPDGIAVDFTMGNGNDTLFLCRHTEGGHVYAFDVQQQAYDVTEALLKGHGEYEKATLILDSHSNLKKYVSEPIDVGVFNLGYLPRSDKKITTHFETVLEALKQGLELLKLGGVIILVIYPGHEEGAREARLLQEYCSGLDRHRYNVLLYQFLNKNDPPRIIAIEYYKNPDA